MPDCKHHPFDRDEDENENIICTNCGEIIEYACERFEEEQFQDECHMSGNGDCDWAGSEHCLFDCPMTN